jgi:hypothetical protein
VGGFISSHYHIIVHMIQDCVLAFSANLLAHLSLTWIVWGVTTCSFWNIPTFTIQSHLALAILLLLSNLVGSLFGIGEMNNNDGSFTLLLTVMYWWSVKLLPTLEDQTLSPF